MKRITLIITAIVMSAHLFAQTQGDDNGLELKFQVGVGNSDEYGMGKNFKDWSKSIRYQAKTSFGGTIANRWYLAYPGNLGIALQAKWAEFNITKSEFTNEQSVKEDLNIYNVEALGLGAILTFYLGDHIALDINYNLSPSMLLIHNKNATDNSYYEDVPPSDLLHQVFRLEEKTNAGFGLSNTIGAALRLWILELGADYKFSSPTHQSWFDGELCDQWIGGEIIQHYNANRLRVFIGLKF